MTLNYNINKFCKKLLIITSLAFTAFKPAILLAENLNNPVIQNALTGLITDYNNNPLSGVTIKLKNSPNTSTSSNEKGEFRINVPTNSILIFTAVGYKTLELNIENNKVMQILMESADATKIEDVVVTSFNTKVKKTDLIGSVTSIRPEELQTSSSNLTTALAGRLAGMIAYQRSGEPGADNADFFIRGVTTFGYKQDPLILIDNMEMTTRDLARLQVQDIEGFSILKDATTTAVYGARGANGVILVTTKQGKEGKARLSITSENSISAPTKEVEISDPITYMRLHNEAILTRNPYAPLMYSEEKIKNTINNIDPVLYPKTDWKNILMKDYTFTQRNNINISGGGGVARYFVSASLNRDHGILKSNGKNNFNSNIKLNTYNLRSNVNINLTKSTELIVRLSGSFDDYKGPIPGEGGTTGGASAYKLYLNANPVLFPAFYENISGYEYTKHIMFGNFERDGKYLNPYAEIARGYRDASSSTMYAQLELNQNLNVLTEGLKFRALANTTRTGFYDVSRAFTPYYYGPWDIDAETGKAKIQLLNELKGTEYLDYIPGETTNDNLLYLESALNYNRTFNEKHNFSGLLVTTMRHRISGNAYSLQSSLPYRNLGISGKATYNYDNRYFGEFNFGYNGSERFAKEHRFGFFPSVGAAWSISNENFWEPIKHIFNNFRIRATYGLVGNDQIGSASSRFFYLSEANLNDSNRGFVFGDNYSYSRPGISIRRYANPNVSWETSYKKNLALEIGLFDKIEIIGEYFTDNRIGILQTRSDIPNTMGLSSQIQANVGKAFSQGIDGSISFNHSFSSEWSTQVQGNFTYATGKYKNYEEVNFGYDYRQKEGKPITQTFGLVAERLFISDAEVFNSPRQNYGSVLGGDIKYIDINGDGEINDLDMVPIGYPTTPEIIYGFGFSNKYKGFDFSAFIQGSARSSFLISYQDTSPFTEFSYRSRGGDDQKGHRQLIKAYANDYWSEDNQNIYALFPRLSTTPITNNSIASTWWLRDGAFLRVKQIELGYRLPNLLLDRWKIASLRVYTNVNNPFLISGFKMWDIEQGGNGLNYPIQRVFNLGFNLGF